MAEFIHDDYKKLKMEPEDPWLVPLWETGVEILIQKQIQVKEFNYRVVF